MPAVIVGNQVAVMLYDASGNPMFVANGSPVTASGVPIMGSDGTNARFLRTANDGTVRMDPTGTTTQPVSAASLPLPAGAATSANQTTANGSLASILAQLDVALSTRASQATLATLLLDATFTARVNTLGQKAMAASTPVVVASDQSTLPVSQQPTEEATYTAAALAVTVGNGKSLLGLFNPASSGYLIKLREVYLRNARTTAVTGVAGAFQIMAIRDGSPGISAGTDVTPIAHDSADALPAGLVCKTGGTVTGETSTPFDIMRMSTDEWGPGTLDQEGAQQTISNYLPARVKRDSVQKPLIAREGEGIHLKFATNSTAGDFDIVFIFTKVAL